ncbi:MAG: hypothetical protein L0922_06900, partial [Candidatus Mariimomonas ferrooxydans]
MHKEKILVLDFGSQYTQLIARRVRENKVYSEILPFNFPLDKIKEFAPKGIILSGGPFSVYDKKTTPHYLNHHSPHTLHTTSTITDTTRSTLPQPSLT